MPRKFRLKAMRGVTLSKEELNKALHSINRTYDTDTIEDLEIDKLTSITFTDDPSNKGCFIKRATKRKFTLYIKIYDESESFTHEAYYFRIEKRKRNNCTLSDIIEYSYKKKFKEGEYKQKWFSDWYFLDFLVDMFTFAIEVVIELLSVGL